MIKLDNKTVSKIVDTYVDGLGITDENTIKDAKTDFKEGFEACRLLVLKNIKRRKLLANNDEVSSALHYLLMDFSPE